MLRFPVLVRSLLLALILGALWNPRLPWQASPIDLMVLVDASRSVDPASRDAAWRSVASSTRGLPTGSRVAIVRFGADTVEELNWTDIGSNTAHTVLAAATPPQSHFLDDTHTDIASAMEHALRLSEPGRLTRIVLVSDGLATTGQTTEALQLARTAGIPVYTVITPGNRKHDSWITSLEAPNRIHAGQMLPVTVILTSNEKTRGTVVMSLDGVPAASREVMLSPSLAATLHMDLPLPASRTAVLSAQLHVEGDTESRNNRMEQIVNIEGVSPVLYLSGRVGVPMLARSLRAGGWDVELATPAGFTQRVETIHPVSIVLDDIAIADMAEEAWEALTRQVMEEGTGLLVLGGPHAFGAGGYRHSLLEDILPVTAEAREPLPPAAVLFMLDTSGSMDRHDKGPSRLALARQAVLESVYRLQPDDAVGLLEFAAEPHLTLPPAVQRDAAAAIRDASQSAPAGGTRLGPALRRAVTTLAGLEFKQKLLILVTDGQVDKTDFGDIAAQIREAGIDVIALAIGSDADTTALLPLTRINNGQLLRVDQVAQLPTLMRNELDKQRSLTATGQFIPATAMPLPFLPGASADWPTLEAYAVTRERASATVYLRVQGDPLFAAQYAGAGRVAVFTASLDDWQAFWAHWPDNGRFAGGVMDWIDAQHGAGELHLSARQAGGAMLLTLEAPVSATDDSLDSSVMIQDPSGETLRYELPARAPGRYEARIATAIPGQYRAIIRNGNHQAIHDWLYGGNDEFLPLPRATQRLSEWQQSGLLQPWSESILKGINADAMPGSLRSPLLIITTLIYLFLLLWERRADLVRSAVDRLHHASRSLAHRLGMSGSTA
jgi:Mg-chelatase subunit ChlD